MSAKGSLPPLYECMARSVKRPAMLGHCLPSGGTIWTDTGVVALKKRHRQITLNFMNPERITVFFPCHTLDDFPTWLDETQADDLLAAWTAAWNPRLVATVGRIPSWESVDAPTSDGVAVLGIVPITCDDRFSGFFNASCTAQSRFVRQVTGRSAIVAAAEQLLVESAAIAPPESAVLLDDDFYALGLAWLIAELLARRMRTASGLESTGFAESVVAAAHAAVSGDATAARAHLQESFGYLTASRSHAYPVDVWLLDLVLLAETTAGPALAETLASPVPLALVATGRAVESLAERHPAQLEQVRKRCAAGTLAPAGGRYDSQPLDACSPEEILASLQHGMSVWRTHVGRLPTTYAQCSGGSSAILPQLLKSVGYAGAIWNLFDGTPLPDPGTSRIRWEGTGAANIDGVGRPPLDARSAQTVLMLAEKIGDAMDNDHTAIIQFAHYAGTASPWFLDLRRIGAWSNVLGTFVTPDELFRRTTGAGAVCSFEPDSFPTTLPAVGHTGTAPIAAAAEQDLIGQHVAAACTAAEQLLAATEKLMAFLPPPAATVGGQTQQRNAQPTAGLWQAITAGVFGAGSKKNDTYILEDELIRVQVQCESGGMLSLRRPCDRGNQISQRLALRTTLPAPALGQPWETAQERAGYSEMVADTIQRFPPTDGRGESIESRGRLTDAQNRDVGSFTQRITLAGSLPLVLLDIDIKLADNLTGAVLENHAACRFAWNENDDSDLLRSLHTQSIVTERTRFTATHFVEVRSVHADNDRSGLPVDSGRISIFTCGLPWHLRSAPHMLDSILLAGNHRQASRSLAIGLGILQPWDVAIALCGKGLPQQIARGAANVRLTAAVPLTVDGRVVGISVGLLESAGQAGDVRIQWGADIDSARVQGPLSEPVPEVVIDGRATVVFLRRYQWLHLEIGFRT